MNSDHATLTTVAPDAMPDLARRADLTPGALVRGAWAIVLGRHLGDAEVRFTCVDRGVPRSTHVHVDEQAPLLPWLRDLPADHAPQDGSTAAPHGPLTRSVVRFDDAPLPGARAEAPPPSPLILLGSSRAAPWTFELAYDPAQIDEASARILLGHLRSLLASMASDPDRRIAELPMITAEEQTLLRACDPADDDRPLPAAHVLFAAHAARDPGAVAAALADEVMTYGELDEQSDRLARHLRGLGVGPEVRVGLCVDRSFALLVGVLGVLKAGGACVPIDPRYPAERIGFILRDAAVPILLTRRDVAATLPAHAANVVDLDAVPAADGPRLVDAPSPGQLAYVIYTSGSTGAPKGVLAVHRGLANLVRAQAAAVSPTPASRVLQFAALGFDAAVWEIFMALAFGATLVLGSAASLLPGPNLAGLLRAQRVSHATLPPSALALLHGEPLPDLSHLVVAGEACPPGLARRWSVGRRFFNAYGPTECTVCATIAPLDERSTRPWIGRALAGIEVHVLDRDLRPAPIDVPGELYLGGAGLARGYLDRPDLTRERFIAHPFAGRPDARLYRTGDLARRGPDGQLEFLGRVDTQVKLRGFRIELGEIEATLRGAPDVVDAVVRVREDRLVAWYVGPAEAAALRPILARTLPEFMMPGAYVRLDALPLTPHGKLDERRLPAPAWTSDAPYVAPRDEVEAQLAALWSSLLGVPQVGVHANFFELGGHSLTAARLLAQVHAELRVQLPLRCLFDHPTIAGLAAQVAAAGAAPQAPRTGPQRAPRDAVLPASFAQERVHFIEQMSPGSSAYQAQCTLALSGRLDVPALQRAIAEIVRRHEIFRTTFPTRDDRLVQEIHPPWPVTLPVVDLRAVPIAEQPAAVRRHAEADARRPFAIDRLPLVRWTLLVLGEDQHKLIHTEHHMVHDGWSAALFVGELLTLHETYSRGEPSPLPEPSLQFADYAVWQRAWANGDEARAQLEFWRRTLADAPPLLELPIDHPRPAEQTHHGRQLRVELPPDLCAGLRAVSRQAQTTLFMTMFAAFLVVLRRHTGQDDLCVGSAVANRGLHGSQGLIGMIVNNVVLRTTIAGDPTFRELLAQVRRVTLDAYAHEELPFDKVVEVVKPVRDPAYNPLFQAMFSFHDAPLPAMHRPGLDAALEVALGNDTAKFDLDVVAIPHAEQRLAHASAADERGVSMIWEYNSDLFEPATIARMEAHYQHLLAGVIADPDARLSALPRSPDEQRRLAAWNDTAAPAPDVCVHRTFEARAASTPHALAAVQDARSLTYAELNARANQLARDLQARGVGPDTLVGLCIDRSLEQLVGALGVLKAGGAYVPIDPTYPDERLAYILEDAAPVVVLTHSRLAPRFAGARPQLVCLDDWRALGAHARTDLTTSAQPHDLAYMIYTSGSTGSPKGVMIEHRSLANFAASAAHIYGITAGDRALQFASITFDTAVEEIYPTLTVGAALLLRNESMLHTSDDFWRTCRDWGVTVLNFPTAFWQQLAAELEPSDPRVPQAVHTVIVGGEAMRLDKLRRWHRGVAHLSPPPRLWNGYGPTEATVTATLHCNDPAAQDRVPIGRPLRNTQIHLLDRDLQAAPIGAPGELCIGGLGLARGYWRRPGLTASRFVETEHGRLYRTGDRARLAADGALEYLGRLDDQVKIRGFRVELGEIQTVLGEHPDVLQTAVLVREDAGSKRLVAYVVPRRADTSVDALRRFLADKLPAYMVPAAFVLLAALPLTTSNKLDVRALPAPTPAREPTDDDGPLTPTEAALAAIWSTVLRVPSVRPRDNFFELGGDSILSIQVVAAARRAGLELTPRLLFHHQTVQSLAAAVDASHGAATRRAPDQGPVTGPVPLTPIQRWFFDQRLPAASHFNQSALLAAPADLDPDALRRAFAATLAHHDALRMRYTRSGDTWQQTSGAADEPPAFTVVDLSHLPRGDQEAAVHAAEAEAQRSLDLTAGPIARLTLLRGGPDQPGWSLLVIHHLAVDAVSWRILLEDLEAAYRGQPLPAKTTSFKEWATRLAAHADSDAALAERDHWAAQVAPTPALPVDFAVDPASDTMATAATWTLRLTEAETHALLRDVPAVYNTQINDVLLTALLLGFHAWTGASALTLDLEGHGREDLFDADLSRTVGWFTTLFPVRLELPGPDVGEALKSVKEQLRKIPRHGLGHGLLRHLRADGQDLAAAPAVSFNYLGQFDGVLSADTALGTMLEWKLSQADDARRSHTLAIGAAVRGGRLETIWGYGARVHREATIQRLADATMAALRGILAHCAAPGTGGFTPSDFLDTALDQSRLDKLLGKVRRPRAKP